MTRWQRFLAFFGLYTPPAPTELGSLNDLYTPNATTIAAMHEARSIHRAARPEKRLYAPKPTIRAKLPPVAPTVQRDHTADVLLGAAAGYALGSLSHHESSYTPTPSPSYDSDSSPSSSDSGGFSGGGGDFGGGGSSGDFGGGSSD